MSKFKIYLKSILIPVIVGAVVSFIISDSIDYNTLRKPFFAPPSIAFPIIWTILYVFMGVSYGRLKSKSLVDTRIQIIYYGQLFINAMWSIIFFVLKWRLFAFLWILLLDVFVIKMFWEFYDKDKSAGLLQIPYIIWIVFASFLNLSIYLLNK